mgnify:CR=1 FL=1
MKSVRELVKGDLIEVIRLEAVQGTIKEVKRSMILTCDAEVRDTKHGPSVYFAFTCPDNDYWYGGGAASIYQDRSWMKLGIKKVKFIRNVRLYSGTRLPNLVGNPGYDLMHDPRS